VLNRVFGPTLPETEQIVLTDMTGLGRADFVFPTAAGLINGKHRILVSFGASLDKPLEHPRTRDDPPGEQFIHEMTHAWQIQNSPSMAEWIPRAIATRTMHPGSITVPSENADWDSFNLEEQASVVEYWFGLYQSKLDSDEAQNDPYFKHIRDHIRKGRY
jgi:hypothetical protein